LADPTNEIERAPPPHPQRIGGLALAALGIVFRDIGTSPLYTFKTVVVLAGGKPTPQSALGLLSLLVWTLIVTVSSRRPGASRSSPLQSRCGA
jgi:KUP system potassium uptake protein